MILSDVLRPNIQRLQDHRANLGINAADGIQMLVFFGVPGISRYVRYVQVGFQTLFFPCIFTYCRVSILGKTITSLKLVTLHCFNPGRMPIWSISKQHCRCRCCRCCTWVKAVKAQWSLFLSQTSNSWAITYKSQVFRSVSYISSFPATKRYVVQSSVRGLARGRSSAEKPRPGRWSKATLHRLWNDQITQFFPRLEKQPFYNGCS